MNERLKSIRKSLSMTQKDFGAELGVSRDTYASYESGRVIPNNTFIQLMCSKFNVNEEWLRTGDGEMFIKTKRTTLDELTASYNLNDKEKAIIQAFLDLSPQGRAGVLEYVDKLAGSIAGSAPSRDEQIAQRIANTNKMIENAAKESIKQ